MLRVESACAVEPTRLLARPGNTQMRTSPAQNTKCKTQTTNTKYKQQTQNTNNKHKMRTTNTKYKTQTQDTRQHVNRCALSSTPPKKMVLNTKHKHTTQHLLLLRFSLSIECLNNKSPIKRAQMILYSQLDPCANSQVFPEN